MSELGDHICSSAPAFDFSSLLLRTIEHEQAMLDANMDPSPPPSPRPSALEYLEREFILDLEDLSPLTSPDSSPPQPPSSTPMHLKDPGLDKPPKGQRTQRLTAHRRHIRQQNREAGRNAANAQYQARPAPKAKYVDTAETVFCDMDVEKARVARTGHVALNDQPRSRKTYSLEELVGESSKYKMRLFKWDGKRTVRFVDSSGRVFMVLAGRPDDDDWDNVHKAGAQAMEAQRSHLFIPKASRKHRRGAYAVLSSGVSHGGGQKQPSNLSNHKTNQKVIDRLNKIELFKRLPGFASSVMAHWAPDLHSHYAEMIEGLHRELPQLRRLFPSSIFSAASYNFGPRTVCFRHKDFANVPYGWCTVTALGFFNPTAGGHFVAWDIGLVIEFPAGSTIAFPSAALAHSNTRIGKNERRYSFTQYTAGALFRWADNNMKTQTSYLSSLSPQELLEDEMKNLARWRYGLSLLPTVARPQPMHHPPEWASASKQV